MDVVMAPSLDQGASGGTLQPSRHFLAAAVKRCRWLPVAPVDLSSEEQAAEGMPAALALWSGDVQVRPNAVRRQQLDRSPRVARRA